MNNFNIDPTCFDKNGLNPSLFPVGTAQNLDINFNILPFLCDLLKATTDDNVSPMLTDPPPEFDITPFTDFSALNAIGDPRVSLGEVMTQTYINFLPRVIAQTEVRQNGGSRIVDGYICNSDGVPIKKSETISAILSLDLTGKVPYQYGAITVPPITATYEELMKPLDSEEIKQFVSGYVNNSKNAYAEFFAQFVKLYFKQDSWSYKVNVYDQQKYIITEITKMDKGKPAKPSKIVYLKYYYDVANQVACLLELTKMDYLLGTQTPSSMAIAMAQVSVIPDYKMLIENKVKGDEFYKKIMGLYVATPDNTYTSLLANSANAVAFFNDIAYRLNSFSISSVNVNQCFN